MKAFEEKMYGDVWDKEKYLNWMYENLMAIKSVMSENASIYVHIDWHIGHYVKILLDEVFGEDNFRNEITWVRTASHNDSKQNYSRVKDSIFFYSRSEEYPFNIQYTPYTEEYIADEWTKAPSGRYYKFENMLDPQNKMAAYDFHGTVARWRTTPEKFEELWNAPQTEVPNSHGRVRLGKNGKPIKRCRIVFMDELPGVPLNDNWSDIAYVAGRSAESANYSTQKPEALLNRIITSSSNENMIVADFFGGSGVTAAVANKLARKFIHCDIGLNSVQTTRDRLVADTVVLFLEKYNEPSKKADLIEDSIDAVFNGCNLDGWEDKAILEQYLKKIDVSSEVYERFLSEAVDIGDIEDKYFLKYKEAFLALSKTKEKQKQKTFGKLSEKEQKKLLTKQYYQYVKKIEREKMKYFSFVYDQRTLIVAAPDDNKGQEKFLGYKWSNRKGQEGIQIIDEGGMLYDAENRMSDRTIASLIRKMFNGEEVSLDDLEEYYYYLHTKDMISFSEVYFNKAIKTTKTRLLKDDPGLTVYSLSNEKTFDITIGDRVLSEEIVSGGRVPVYSANVYEEFGRIDKENMKDYSRPSVIWGIDGDWMVNIIPAGVPFYPTDHCGVLRIKTEKILPEYMMYALQAEGEYERFSRNNRASAQRIRSLVVQAPETKIQKNIIDELKALDDKINGQNAEIEKYENSIRTKFDQIFHLEEFISDGVFSKYEGYSVEDLCIDGRGRVINQQYIENHKGPYPVYSSQTTNDGIFGSIDTFDFDGEYITWTTDGAKAGTVFYRNGKFNCTNVCGTLKAKNDKVNMRYLAYLLNRIAYKFVSRVGNNKLMNDAMKKIVVPVPKRQLQDEFADFVQSVEKSKFECIGKKEKFEIEKDTFVHKYFR